MPELRSPAKYPGHGKLSDAQTAKDRSRRSGRECRNHPAPPAGSNKPPGWNRWSPAEKAEHLLGLSLDRMHEYLSWPADDLDLYRLATQTQVIRVSQWSGPRSETRPGESARDGELCKLLRKIEAENPEKP